MKRDGSLLQPTAAYDVVTCTPDTARGGPAVPRSPLGGPHHVGPGRATRLRHRRSA